MQAIQACFSGIDVCPIVSSFEFDVHAAERDREDDVWQEQFGPQLWALVL